MTSRIVAGSLLGVLVLAGNARGSQQSEPIVLLSSQDDAGVVTEYRVSEARLAALKPWSPERELPPLSIAKALAIAKKRLKPGKPADLVVTDIELNAVNSGGAFRWYYRVHCYDSADVLGGSPPEMQDAVVLMDGSLVEPVKRRHQ